MDVAAHFKSAVLNVLRATRAFRDACVCSPGVSMPGLGGAGIAAAVGGRCCHLHTAYAPSTTPAPMNTNAAQRGVPTTLRPIPMRVKAVAPMHSKRNSLAPATGPAYARVHPHILWLLRLNGEPRFRLRRCRCNRNYRLRLLLHSGVQWNTRPTARIRGRHPRLVA